MHIAVATVRRSMARLLEALAVFRSCRRCVRLLPSENSRCNGRRRRTRESFAAACWRTRMQYCTVRWSCSACTVPVPVFTVQYVLYQWVWLTRSTEYNSYRIHDVAFIECHVSSDDSMDGTHHVQTSTAATYSKQNKKKWRRMKNEWGMFRMYDTPNEHGNSKRKNESKTTTLFQNFTLY